MRAFRSDGLTDSSFERGDASRYAVIIDTNTSIMDDKLLADITRYVEAGGTFVTFARPEGIPRRNRIHGRSRL